VRLLWIVLGAYALASLAHHVHNAEFLADYPHMPAGATREIVYAVWAATTAVGIAGLFYRPLLALYALIGLYGLAHYWLAPFSAHSVGMNVTILLEAGTATLLLMFLWRREKN
jgi:hypothetical protein